jgi:hypothetical protein
MVWTRSWVASWDDEERAARAASRVRRTHAQLLGWARRNGSQTARLRTCVSSLMILVALRGGAQGWRSRRAVRFRTYNILATRYIVRMDSPSALRASAGAPCASSFVGLFVCAWAAAALLHSLSSTLRTASHLSVSVCVSACAALCVLLTEFYSCWAGV